MEVSFATWFRPLKIYAVDGNVAKISAPDEQMLRYIQKKYGMILRISIEEVTGFDCTVEFVTVWQEILEKGDGKGMKPVHR